MRVLVLQHIACEPPGVYEDVLDERGFELKRVEIDAGEPLPAFAEFDAVVAMGGPMSAGDDHRLPWLREEKAWIADAVRANVPYWGVCLGVQLLAASLGARVYTGSEPEVGVLPVALTDEGCVDPVFAGLPRSFPTLQWHGDTFELPDGAVRLAGSAPYRNQAFRVKRAYGVQFHLEVSPAMAREWAAVPEYDASLRRVLGADGAAGLLRAVDERAPEMLGLGRGLFERFLDQVVVGAMRRETLEV